jgi:hypothetical protein
VRRIWNNVVLQEREWAFEAERVPYYGDYYFNDTPLAQEGAFPELARVELSHKNVMPKPEWSQI